MPKKLKSGFVLVRDSDLTYEKMTVEIQYEEEQIAQINMDQGFDNLEIEVFTEFIKPDFKPKFQVNEFIEAVREAQNILGEYNE